MRLLSSVPAVLCALAVTWTLALLAADSVSPAYAQAEETVGAAWTDLPAALRPRLESLAPQWPQWSTQQRERVRRRAERWLTLSDSEQSVALQRLERWRALGPAMHAALRQNLPHWETLDLKRQQRLLARMQQFEQQPEAERAALLSAFDALGSAARRALLPPLPDGELSRLARELFVFVPIDERKETLLMLGSLSDSAMLDLRAVVEHRAPWQNEALRRELLDQPSPQREAWLSKRRAQR